MVDEVLEADPALCTPENRILKKKMDEFAELIRREFEEIASEEEKELENMELGLSDEEFQVIKARALNGVIERIRLHQQNEKSCYL